MRKIKLNAAVSLDGLIEGPSGEYDWCFTDQDYGMTEFLESIDTVLFGRKSYQLLIKDFTEYYPDKKKIVFSRTIKEFPQAEVISDNLAENVHRLKYLPGKDIFLFGGAELVTQLLNADLIDEMHLAIHPIVLGRGKHLFSGVDTRKYFNVAESKLYDNGLLQVIYRRK